MCSLLSFPELNCSVSDSSPIFITKKEKKYYLSNFLLRNCIQNFAMALIAIRQKLMIFNLITPTGTREMTK